MRLSDVYTQKSVGRKVLQYTMFPLFGAMSNFCGTKNLFGYLLISKLASVCFIPGLFVKLFNLAQFIVTLRSLSQIFKLHGG